MSLKAGIVGLPNVGKSTLFKALTKKEIDINNYPFCTIEPNVGIVEVPDARLAKLGKFSKSKKLVPAVIEFVDIAGLVKGASEGEGLGNKFLANIREVDAIVQVVRVFENDKIIHVHSKVNPLEDIDVINAELILADLDTVNKRIIKLEKEARGGDKEAIKKLEVTKKIKQTLEGESLANTTELNLEDRDTQTAVRELALLTMKPFLYVYNVADAEQELPDELEAKPHIKLDVKTEEEIDSFSAQEKEELGVKSDLDKLIIAAYDLLGLQTFLTTGEMETRAWTFKKDSTAPRAGASIHGDFEEKFICAEVINWEKLLEAGSRTKAKELGLMKIVGKDYIVEEGDVIEFKV